MYPRILDIVCSNLGKIAETAVWHRPAADATDTERSLREVGSSGGAGEDVVAQVSPRRPVQCALPDQLQIQHYIAGAVLPNLRSFLLDNDKVAASCSTVAMTNIAPAFKQQKWVMRKRLVS